MSKQMSRALVLAIALALTCSVPAFVMADGLAAPTGVQCSNDGTTVSASWDALAGVYGDEGL